MASLRGDAPPAAAARTPRAPGPIEHMFRVLSAEEIQEKRDLQTKARALVTALCVANGLPPSKIPIVYAEDSFLYKCVMRLRREDMRLASETIIRVDVKAAHELLVSYIKRDLVGTSGCLMADAASLKDEKATAIVYWTHQGTMHKPVLLCILFPEGVDEDGIPVVYDHKKAAADIRAACASFGIDIPTQVTCFMGDNITFNDALQKLLANLACLVGSVCPTPSRLLSRLACSCYLWQRSSFKLRVQSFTQVALTSVLLSCGQRRTGWTQRR